MEFYLHDICIVELRRDVQKSLLYPKVLLLIGLVELLEKKICLISMAFVGETDAEGEDAFLLHLQDESLNLGFGGEEEETFVTKLRTIFDETSPLRDPFGFVLAIMKLVLGSCSCCWSAPACRACFYIGVVACQSIFIAEFVIGCIFAETINSPQEWIAFLLIAGGLIGMTAGLLNGKCDNLFFILFLSWLNGSAIILYRYYDKVSYVEGDPQFCDPLPFRFLFWIVAISLTIVLCCALCVVGATLTIVAAGFNPRDDGKTYDSKRKDEGKKKSPYESLQP